MIQQLERIIDEKKEEREKGDRFIIHVYVWYFEIVR